MQLPDLGPFVSLEKLDLSINQLRSMAPLSTLQAFKLKEAYLTSNKITTIEVCGSWISSPCHVVCGAAKATLLLLDHKQHLPGHHTLKLSEPAVVSWEVFHSS